VRPENRRSHAKLPVSGRWRAARSGSTGRNSTAGPPEDLGSSIGYVPQDVALFEGTTADNIARLEDERDSSAIVAATKAASIHEMILGLPDGYETNVGPDGSALSASASA
jgi:ATP-binding cassette subfamily C protein